MKKKALSLFLILTIMMSFSVFTRADSPISVFLDGKQIQFDTQPTIIDGRTMVPLRAIFEALNAKVSWNDSTKTVVASRDSVLVSVTVDVPVLTKNGEEIPLDAPPKIINGRTLVPVRAVAESFDADVSWDGETRSVKIFSTKEDKEAIEDIKRKDYVTFEEYMNSIESKIVAGGNHMALISPDNSLWMWGDNHSKQISQSQSYKAIYEPIKIMENVEEVALGENHTLILGASGYLYALGSNSFGQTGGASGKSPIMKSVVSIAASNNHSIAITKNGDIYGCGENNNGQLGKTLPKKVSEFQLISSNAKKAYTEKDYSVILNMDGTADVIGNIREFFHYTHRNQLEVTDISTNNKKIHNVSDVETYENAIIVYGKDGSINKYLRGNDIKERFDSVLPPRNTEFSNYTYEYIDNGVLYLKNPNGIHIRNKPIMDDVHYYTKTTNGTHIAVLKDSSVYLWGNDLNGVLGIGENPQQQSLNTQYPCLVFNSVYPYKVTVENPSTDTPVFIEILDTKYIGGYFQISVNFKNSNSEIVFPLGNIGISLINPSLTDSTTEYIICQRNAYITPDNYDENGTVTISIPQSHISSTSDKATLNVSFNDIDTGISCQKESIKVPKTLTTFELQKHIEGILITLRNQQNSITSEKYEHISDDGTIIMTHDTVKFAEIQEKIEYYNGILRKLPKA